MLWLETERLVECPGLFIFYLYFNVRYAALCATVIYRFKQGTGDALASGFGAYVEVFDADEVPARGDVEAVGEDEYTNESAFRQSGQYLHVSGVDSPAQSLGEILGDRFAISEGFF